MAIKTTISLREDLYRALVRTKGKRRLSQAVNEALVEYLATKKKSLFGVDPWLDTAKLRDEEEPHEDL